MKPDTPDTLTCVGHTPRRYVSAAALLLAFSSAAAGGCAYPRRTTRVQPAVGTIKAADRPDNLWELRLESADVPPRKASGHRWDDDSSKPDPFFRLQIDGREVWRSPTRPDTLQPAWRSPLPRNIHITRRSRLQLELWDDDGPSADPIGVMQRRGLPSSMVIGASTRLSFRSMAVVTLSLHRAKAHRGIGIRLFEVHSDELRVLEVEPYSPAARAGIKIDDRIVAIGEQAVAELGEQAAVGQLSLAADKQAALSVVGADGRTRKVNLDSGYLWLTM